jgi:hypothetical protein
MSVSNCCVDRYISRRTCRRDQGEKKALDVPVGVKCNTSVAALLASP